MLTRAEIPEAFRTVKEGDWLTVKDCYMGRSKQSGLVISVFDDGVGLDFFTCGLCGQKNCHCYMSIEHWLWDELEAP